MLVGSDGIGTHMLAGSVAGKLGGLQTLAGGFGGERKTVAVFVRELAVSA